MASGIGKEIKKWGAKFDDYNPLYGKDLYGGVSKGIQRGRESLGLKQDTPETPDPAAQSTAGDTQMDQYRKLKGRSSTRVTSRTPLGGGASLT